MLKTQEINKLFSNVLKFFKSDDQQEIEPVSIAEMKAEIEKLKNEVKEKEKLLRQCHNDSIRQTFKISCMKKKIKELRGSMFSYDVVRKNKHMHHYYTGIKQEAFKDILNGGHFKPICKKLKSEDHLLLVLMKLRLGLRNKDLTYRFRISSSVASKIFRQWLPILSKLMLENYYSWPD